MYTLETALPGDVELCYSIIDDARRFQREQGSIQWTDDYPSIETIRGDIREGKGRVLRADGSIVGYMCVDFSGEPAYQDIRGPGSATPPMRSSIGWPSTGSAGGSGRRTPPSAWRKISASGRASGTSGWTPTPSTRGCGTSCGRTVSSTAGRSFSRGATGRPSTRSSDACPLWDTQRSLIAGTTARAPSAPALTELRMGPSFTSLGPLFQFFRLCMGAGMRLPHRGSASMGTPFILHLLGATELPLRKWPCLHRAISRA